MSGGIIAVASGKGGVGKTWLSVTMAHAFANSGRQALLFDGDIGLANVDVQLGINPKHDLGDFLSGNVTLEGAITRFEEGGFDIIAGRSGSGNLASLPVSRLEKLNLELSGLSRNYDVIILDLGAGIEDHVRFLAAAAQKCLVVITDEPTSLTDAYAFIKVMKGLNVHIVVNQAASAKEGEKTYEAIRRAAESFLKFSPPLAGIIRKDPKVKECIKSQSPILSKAPGSTAATDVAALAVKLMAKE